MCYFLSGGKTESSQATQCVVRTQQKVGVAGSVSLLACFSPVALPDGRCPAVSASKAPSAPSPATTRMRTKPLEVGAASFAWLPVRKPIDMSRTVLNGSLLILHPPPNLPPFLLHLGTLFLHAQKPPSLFWQPRRRSHAISIESGQKEEKHLPPSDHSLHRVGINL